MMTRTRVSIPDLPPAPTFGKRKWGKLTSDERTSVLDWVVDVCLIEGAQRSTAYGAAAMLAEALDSDERSSLRVYRRADRSTVEATAE